AASIQVRRDRIALAGRRGGAAARGVAGRGHALRGLAVFVLHGVLQILLGHGGLLISRALDMCGQKRGQSHRRTTPTPFARGLMAATADSISAIARGSSE